MTTLVALATKDSVVMGCDSLATSIKALVDPYIIRNKFFDPDTGLLLMENGAPKLDEFNKVLGMAENVPYSHMSHMDKLFSLKDLPLGAMYTGITSIGEHTIKGLLLDFTESDSAFEPGVSNYTVKSVAERLLKHLNGHYTKHFREIPEEEQPPLELILAGYDKSGVLPRIAKLDVKENKVGLDNRLGPVFGGQSCEIERIVYGMDMENWIRLEQRHAAVLDAFARATLEHNGVIDGKVPKKKKDDALLTTNFNLNGLIANWRDFSEQNAIDCVTYFIHTMIQVQRFNYQMPSVGGNVHVAMINRADRFRFISKEEYSHENHSVKK